MDIFALKAEATIKHGSTKNKKAMNNLPKEIILLDAVSSFELANYIDEFPGNANIAREANAINVYY